MYELSLPLILACDASYYGLGVVISHIYPDGTEKPIAFASRTLNKHEVNYSQVDKEGASIIFGLKKFNQYLLGRQFIISTDNSAIRKIFDPSTALSPIAAARLVRWSLMLTQYDYAIIFKSSKNHCNAMFSRLPLPVESKSPAEDTIYSIQIAYLPVSADDIRIETKNDLILKNVLLYLKDGKWPAVITPEYQPYYNIRQELFIEDNVILWGLKVVIPLTLQK